MLKLTDCEREAWQVEKRLFETFRRIFDRNFAYREKSRKVHVFLKTDCIWPIKLRVIEFYRFNDKFVELVNGKLLLNSW